MVTAAAIALNFALRWPTRSRLLYDWDSALFVHGAHKFDVYQHHPHPPGYPLWIFIMRIAARMGFDLNAAQIFFAIVFGALGATAVAVLAARVVRLRTALLLGAAALLAPVVALSSATAGTYNVDLLTSASIAYFASRLWERERATGWIACALLAFLAGFRAAGALAMVPLLGVALIRANGRDLRAWARAVVPGLLVFAAWFVPVARMHGGAVPFLRFCTTSISVNFRKTTVLAGAARTAHLHQVADFAVWLLINCVGVGVLLLAFRRDDRAPEKRFDTRWFYVIWVLHSVVMHLGIHTTKPGQILGLVPPLLLLAARPIERILERWDGRMGFASATITACAVMAVPPALLSTRGYDSERLERVSLESVRVADEDTSAILSAIRSHELEPREQLVIVASNVLFGPNLRTLELQLPFATRLWAVAPDGTVTTPTNQHFSVGVIPDEVRRVYWIANAHGTYGELLSAMPRTKLIHHSRASYVFATVLGEDGFNESLPWEGRPIRFVQTAKGRHLELQLESGFSEPERDGQQQWIWAGGPESQFRFRFPRAGRVRLLVELDAPPETRQTFDVACNEQPVGTRLELGDNVVHSIELVARAGDNVCRFTFSRWNRHPLNFAPEDSRPLAASVSRLAIEEGSRLYTLFP